MRTATASWVLIVRRANARRTTVLCRLIWRGVFAAFAPAAFAAGLAVESSDMAATPIAIEAAVRQALGAGGRPDVLVKFRGTADVSAAFAIADRDARATYVYRTLSDFAAQRQSRVLDALRAHSTAAATGMTHTVLWIDNSIAIRRLDAATLDVLAASTDVESVRVQQTLSMPPQEADTRSPWLPSAIVPSVAHIHAPETWALGYRGAGVVVANIDTGVRHTHHALVGQYRGNLGAAGFDHETNWYDPYQHASAPRWTLQHGSHTMGTMVGDDGGANQVGVAPDAQWIACIGFGIDSGGSTDAGLIECGQWVLAPYATDGSGTPDPTRRADIVENSWQLRTCDGSVSPFYRNVVDAWIAAGMVPVFIVGNTSNCGLPNDSAPGLNPSPGNYGTVLTVGATGTDNGAYDSRSVKGPTTDLNPGAPTYPDMAGFPELKPNLVAPGIDIYSASSESDDDYELDSGTSMAGPAAAGVVALMWSAAPCLRGNYSATGTLLMSTATRIAVATGSPSDGPGNVPNQAAGWGEVDAFAAVQGALAFCSTGVVAPTLSLSFARSPIMHGGDSVLTIALNNANTSAATLQAALTNDLPAGLVVSSTAAASTTCGGSVDAVAGGASLRLSAGATVPASATCTVDVPVTAAANGVYTATIDTGALQTDKGSNAAAATAQLIANENGQVFPLPYCSASFSAGVEPISRVVFAGIDNTTSAILRATPSLEDFTGTYGVVRQGDVIRIAVSGNTAGDNVDYLAVYADWNRDDVFGDGESYHIGSIRNSSGTDGRDAVASIAIPADASIGHTRLRIVKRYSSSVAYPDACNSGGYGQAEDYSLDVVAAGECAVADTVFCNGFEVGVPASPIALGAPGG